MVIHSLRAFSSLIFVLLLSSQASAQSLNCTEIFNDSFAPNSITYYLDQVLAAGQKAPTPQFMDPVQEAALAKMWGGTRNAPRAIRDALLENTALINFPLLASDAGTVKMSAPGNFTSLRLNHQWQGKNMSTNIGLPIDAIVARGLSGEPYLVPNTAKAVMIFMHGGGTKTTGHHVAAAFSNFMAQYGVVVLSMDAPFHAYGPRVRDLNPMDYYLYLRDFRHEFIPANVPTFIGGHSMGGLHADNLMRISDRSELGFHDAFKGLINLSGPMDNAPGRPLREKGEAEERITSNEDLMLLVPEAERDLSVLLLTQGKSSALSGVSAETFMSMVNWTQPAHNGRSYLPTLVVMGARDALYIGRENIFDQYLRNLDNTDTHLMEKRSNYKDPAREDWISHMIFDHYRPGTKDPETFNLIKEFIEARLGEKLVSENHPLIPDYNGSTVGLVVRVVQEYFNNLAFRKFAHQYSALFKSGTEKMAQMGQRTDDISRETKMMMEAIKMMRKNQEDPEQIAIMQKQLEALQAEMLLLRSQQQSVYIPEGPLKAQATENVNRRRELQGFISTNIQAKKALNKELTGLRKQLDDIQHALSRVVDDVILHDRPRTPAILAAKARFDEALDEMVALQIKMNEENSKMVMGNIERGVFDINPSPELIQIYRDLDLAYARYNQAEAAFKKAIEMMIFLGENDFARFHQDNFIKAFGDDVAFFDTGVPTANSLMGRVEAIQKQIDAMDVQNSLYTYEVNRLVARYVQDITPELFTVEFTTFARELQRPLSDIVGHTSRMEHLWKTWNEMWKERPPEQGTSLY